MLELGTKIGKTDGKYLESRTVCLLAVCGHLDGAVLFINRYLICQFVGGYGQRLEMRNRDVYCSRQ